MRKAPASKLNRKTVTKAARSATKQRIKGINKKLSGIAEYSGEYRQDKRNEKGLLPSSKLTTGQKRKRSELSTIKALKGSLLQPSADMVAVTRRGIRMLQGKETKSSLVKERKRLDSRLQTSKQNSKKKRK